VAAGGRERPLDRIFLRARAARRYFFLIVRRPGSGGAEEELASVRERDVAAVGAQRAVLRLVAVDDDVRARKHRILGDAAAQQHVGAAGLDHPRDDLAVGARDVHVDPGVRVDELDAPHHPFEVHRLVGVELRGEGVMRRRRDGGEQRKAHEGSVVFHSGALSYQTRSLRVKDRSRSSGR
jgi:hypothetical protein